MSLSKYRLCEFDPRVDVFVQRGYNEFGIRSHLTPQLQEKIIPRFLDVSSV